MRTPSADSCLFIAAEVARIGRQSLVWSKPLSKLRALNFRATQCKQSRGIFSAREMKHEKKEKVVKSLTSASTNGVFPESPSSDLAPDSAARLLVHHLVQRGVDTFFGIPGGPIAPVFEAVRLNPSARLIETRHESHAAFAACGYYHSTGKVSALLVTAGPGITNAVTGICQAHLHNVPSLVICGDVSLHPQGHIKNQDCGQSGIDIIAMLSNVTRASLAIKAGHTAVPQTLAALAKATDPSHPGPALVMLSIECSLERVNDFTVTEPAHQSALQAPNPKSVEKTAHWLAAARHPLLVLGAGCFRHHEKIATLVDTLCVPFVTTPNAKGLLSEEHWLSLRNGGMGSSRWAKKYTSDSQVDVALVLGSNLDDVSIALTPYVGLGGRLIHVDTDPEVFNRNLSTTIGVVTDVGLFAESLCRTYRSPPDGQFRAKRLMEEVRSVPAVDFPSFVTDDGDPIPPQRAIADLQSAVGPDARFVADIGAHMLFSLHLLTARHSHAFKIWLSHGSMGCGIGSAVGQALDLHRGPVVCICGDGCMQMSGMEILTAAKYSLPIVFAVFNDSRYNMVYHGMKEMFGGGYEFNWPSVNFAMWASSLGVPSAQIRGGGEINKDLLQSLRSDKGPILLDILIDPDVVMSNMGRLSSLTEKKRN